MISRALARFASRLRRADIPVAARREAVRSIFNVVGTALAGAGDDGVRRIATTVLPFSGPATSTLIGRAERADCLTAAFLNALAANVFDFDDTHPGTIIHPSAPVAPALFALAGQQRMGGAALIDAFVLGVEVECRLGNAISPGHYERGWHITATCGVFGAAAACGMILGLDEEQMLWALGHASAQSSGLVETLGTMAKSVGVGHAGRGGLLAALLAAQGVRGPEAPIEGERGFFRVMGIPVDTARVVDGLGESWEITRNTYKPYPCGIVLNPVVDACLALREEHAPAAQDIACVTVHGHPLLRQRADRPQPDSGRQAQVSAQHAVAVVLLDGRAGISEFSDGRVRAPEVRALAAKVAVAEATGVSVDGALVEIRFASGAVLAHRVEQARGSAARPMTDADLETKFRALAETVWANRDPAPLVDALWSLDAADDAADVIRRAAAER
jgi:2-methylcitrate dehydratase PrpD